MRLLRLFELPTGAVGGAAIPALLRPHRVQVISNLPRPGFNLCGELVSQIQGEHSVFGNLSGTIKDFPGFTRMGN